MDVSFYNQSVSLTLGRRFLETANDAAGERLKSLVSPSADPVFLHQISNMGDAQFDMGD